MIRTIIISDYIHVQGKFVRALDGEDIVVCTGSREFVGKPLDHMNIPQATPTSAGSVIECG